MKNSHRINMVVILSGVVLSLQGCGVSFFPSSLYQSEYTINRNGHFFEGNRCSENLVEIGVFLDWPSVDKADPSYFDTAVWHAVADPSVPEFELFATDQAGVTVLAADVDTFPPGAYYTVTRSSDGYRGSSPSSGPPTRVTDGMVGSSAGVMTWEEFMDIPDTDFGCKQWE